MAADSPDKVKNSTLVFDDDGRRVARYDKVHLFGFRKGEECYDESATIEAGNEVVAFEAPCGQVGLSICYDLRFPEVESYLAREIEIFSEKAIGVQIDGDILRDRGKEIQHRSFVLKKKQSALSLTL